MSLGIFLLILIVLILVHELGHFFAAKLFGIKVEEFGIFFPPRLFSWGKGETTYSFNALPFGGYVKIFGETLAEGEALSPEEKRRNFSHRSRPVQITVLAAGIVSNLLFAWLILSLGYMVGMPASGDRVGYGTVTGVHTTIAGVIKGSPAEKAGIQAGDTVLSVATATTSAAAPITSDSVQAFIAQHAENSIVLTTLREGEQKVFIAKPAEGLIEGRKALGVELDDVGVLVLPIHLALAQGAVTTWHMTSATAVGLGHFFSSIFQGTADLSQVSGPVGIASIGSEAVQAGFAAAVVITALISINLALLNLLPIPGLDGGRIFITLIEGIVRRRLPERVTAIVTILGFALLIGLMLVVSVQDIKNLLHA